MFAAKKSGTVPPDNTPAEVPPPRPDGLAGEWLPVTGFSGETPHQQSLRLLRFKPQVDNDRWYYPLSLFNGDFARSGSVRRLALYPDRDKAKYCFWKQPKPADGVPPRREQLVRRYQTLEDLAAVPDSSLGEIGLDGRVLRDMAKAELQAKKDLSPVVMELASAKETMRQQQEQIDQLMARLDAQEKKRGRRAETETA